MKEIDTSGWGEFRVGELFDVVKGSRLRSVDRVDGEIPYIGATLFDNGYVQTIGNDESLHPGGVLTACYNGRATGVTFYQPEQFWATDDVNVLYPKFEMSEEIGLFIAPVIQSVGMNFGWESKWNLPDMIEAVIRLPVTVAGDPDWGYMERTMRDVMTKQEHELDELSYLAEIASKVVSSQSWGEFAINDLFEVKKGTRLTKSHMQPGTIRHIGASQFDNGVTAMISNDEAVHPGNLITVCYDGPVGTTFYQPEDFWATDAVNVLYPRFDLNEPIGLFLAPVIQEAGSAFDYGQKWGAELMRLTPIRLPVTAAGDPDWGYMEQTMRDAMAERERALDSLQAIAGV